MKFRLIAKAAAAVIAVTLSGLTFAVGEQTGLVTEIAVRASDGLVTFKLSNNAGPTRPYCASLSTYWIIKDENSESGKRQLALLMMARAEKLPVTVKGTGACTRWPDGEDVNLLIVQ